MNLYAVALFCHVLVVVYLLGADLGRLHLARTGAAPATPVPARMLAARTALWLGSVTNAALILVMPAGVGVGGALGAYRVTGVGWLAATGLVTLAWLALSVAADRAATRPGGGRGLAVADVVARVVIGAGNLSDGGMAFAGVSETVDAWWLATKICVYGLLIFLSIPVRLVGFRMRRELALLGAVPDDAGAGARLGQALSRLPVPLLASWLLIALAAWMGAAKPV